MKVAAIGAYTAKRYGSTANVGSKVGNSTMVMRRGASRKKRTFATAVKQVVNRGIETKLNSNTVTGTTTHATIYGWNFTAQVTQGTADGNRLGDSIETKKLRFNFFQATPATSGAYSYRLLIFWSGEESNPALPTLTATGALVFADAFLPGATTNTGVIGVTNPKAISIVYDQLFDVNSLVATTPDIFSGVIDVDVSRKLDYQASGSVFAKKQNLYGMLIPYVQGGTANTTQTGTFTANWCLHYKDA